MHSRISPTITTRRVAVAHCPRVDRAAVRRSIERAVVARIGALKFPRRTRAMRRGGAKMGREAGLRLELFVDDMEATVAFYTRVLAFELARHEPGDYASLHLGGVVLGVGPVAKLPEEGGYFGRAIAILRRGLGVEIVIEVDDVEGCHDRVASAGHSILELLQDRPWGLKDFRISDPDGYYRRITSRPTGG